ncbi:MAG: hypothetical protein NTW87_23790 [Planctomycetota bacterium]|nr:hypothetical protein [Planctomycetota bacterium]
MSVARGYQQFAGRWQEHARLAWDTIAMKPTRGIATGGLNVMDWGLLEEISGHKPGSYPKDPSRVYLDFQRAIGATMIDQWIPDNPLSMTAEGYASGTPRNATTGVERIVRDGMVIDSPEAVVAHMEKFLFPQLVAWGQELDAKADERVASLIEKEVKVQRLFGMNMLKGPYDGFQYFPGFHYGTYGYENYFAAYALYPEVMEHCFKLQGDVGEKINAGAASGIVEAGLPGLLRLDHDMAGSRGLLVNVKSLDRIWLPHFARAIKPLQDAGVRLIWHCDGNLMDLVPRLLKVGVGGFQGFQYEDGMDYERICRMKTRDGAPLFIVAGVSVTRTLPHGTVADVRKELRWLVEQGPRVGLFLGASSSVAPGTRRRNVKALIEGLRYYREHGRQGL